MHPSSGGRSYFVDMVILPEQNSYQQEDGTEGGDAVEVIDSTVSEAEASESIHEVNRNV